MKEVILNPVTKAKIETLSSHLPHALLLSGGEGVGLLTIARHIASQTEVKKDAIVVSPDEKGIISIDAVRELYKQTRTNKQNGQIVIIDSADAMREEAQNAFLKLLEEPTSKTSFILTAHSPSKILPTIHSRVQEVIIQPVTKQQTKDFLTKLGVEDQKTRTQISFIASGLPAEIVRLAKDESYFQQQADAARDARTILTGSAYEKLLLIQKYSSDRPKAIRLLLRAMQIIEFSLIQKTDQKLLKQLNQLLETEEHLRRNANVKIQLLKLVINS